MASQQKETNNVLHKEVDPVVRVQVCKTSVQFSNGTSLELYDPPTWLKRISSRFS